MQHLHRGQHGHGGTINPGQRLPAALGKVLFRPQHSIRAFTIADALEAALEGAEIGGGIVVVVGGIIDGEGRVLAYGHGVGFRGCT
ncbi:hypothetical protein [Stenotrophomonas sp. SPM]|uniref:hypothetical protein n=1 Tax=Stenotrophomonas sp. SPM TaxID=2170735 RepID=UPI0014041469|nr:hypothetical protein [Stenotrophomonas sp. SPM]